MFNYLKPDAFQAHGSTDFQLAQPRRGGHLGVHVRLEGSHRDPNLGLREECDGDWTQLQPSKRGDQRHAIAETQGRV